MNGSPSRILVTGSTGFVGRSLVPALNRRGWLVRSAVRQPSRIPDTVSIGSIGPDTDWTEVLAGIDAVVHLAARVHHPGEENNPDIYRIVNTEGTLQLAAEAARVGVRHFVQVSTILVNGSSTDGRAPFREGDTPSPRGVYGHSKAAAEAGLEAIARDTAMQVTVIRPPLIYGPGAGGNFALLAKAVQRGLPLPLASVRNRRSFLAVGNLVSFIVHRLANPGGSFELFVLADDERVSTPDFIRAIGTASGRAARLFSMPTFALDLLCLAAGRSEARQSLLGSLEIDTAKARSTGWCPELKCDDGLRRAFSPMSSPEK